MSQKPDKMDAAVSSLVDALGPFRPEVLPDVHRVSEAISQVLKERIDLDLRAVPDDELEATDVPSRARIALVVSYLKLIGFLLQPGETPSERRAQATLSLDYIKHCNQTGAEALRIGRSLSDDRLQAKVTSLREQLDNLARAKAEVQLEKRDVAGD